MRKPYLVLNRFLSDDKHTIGTLTLYDDDTPICMFRTLELPWRGNQRNISSIPAGIYEGTTEMNLHRGWIIRLNDVPYRSGIQIHMGNYISQTEGCILIGMYHHDFDDDGIENVAYSRVAMNTLRYYLRDFETLDIAVIDAKRK